MTATVAKPVIDAENVAATTEVVASSSCSVTVCAVPEVPSRACELTPSVIALGM